MLRLILFLICVLFLLLGCSSTQDVVVQETPVYTIENNTLLVSLDGFKESCTEPTISVMADDNSWQPTNNIYFLPDSSMLYLNDEYKGHMACDHVVCNPILPTLRIMLREYQLVGERSAPDDETILVPSYQTQTLTGKLKVEQEYFADEACQVKRIYTVILENE